MSYIRPATQANRFYEGDPQRLSEEVNSFLARHKAGDSDQDVAALIVPHAGYYYGSTVPQWMARPTSMPHRWVTCQ